jgi:acetyl-CoA C-acetyltransferase
MMHNFKLGKSMRSVSIVGVGATPFFNGITNSQYKGLTNGELFGYAALDAMKDAHVEPKDVQYFFHGSANPHLSNGCITPNVQVADWFGMRGKGSISHSEGCCTGYIALEEAVFAVASGAYHMVFYGLLLGKVLQHV